MLVGSQIGPFEIEKELGSGAMGTVYRAKFNKGDKVVPVAIKMIALGLLGNEGAMARFEREANILKQLRHANIVRLYATGHYRKTPFIAMEYIDGEALDRVLARRGRLTWEEVAAYGKHLCEALQYAHEKGIIHRDLKPSNLMVTRDGVLKLTDFGIAKDTDVTALTGANSTIGTAAYMSPEQCKGDRNLTHKSDLYSLGIVFFELLSGRKPFAADTTVDMFLKHVNERPPRVGKIVHDLPPKFESVILQLLEKDKDDRPMDAAWVARMLAEIEDDAYARKSAGLEAATARKVDRPAGAEVKPMDEADREAARALKGVKKKKKKKAAVPLFERKWVKATGILVLLGGMAGGAYYVTRPPSAARLLAAIEAAESPSTRGEAAERYLREYGDQPGEATDRAAAAFREGAVRKKEQQLANRYDRPKLRENPEPGDDPRAYAAAMLAMQAEEEGRLDDAARAWGVAKAAFPKEAELPYTLDEATLAKAGWGWLADKRIADIAAAGERFQQLAATVADNRRYERPTSFDPLDPHSLALRAIRLEEFKDPDKAARTWGDLVELTRKDLDLHVWFLLAGDRRAKLPRDVPDAETARFNLVKAKTDEAEKQHAQLKSGSGTHADRIALRSRCLDIVELYGDESGTLAGEVNRARAILDASKQ